MNLMIFSGDDDSICSTLGSQQFVWDLGSSARVVVLLVVGRKWQEMAGNGRKWQEMAGSRVNCGKLSGTMVTTMF